MVFLGRAAELCSMTSTKSSKSKTDFWSFWWINRPTLRIFSKAKNRQWWPQETKTWQPSESSRTKFATSRSNKPINTKNSNSRSSTWKTSSTSANRADSNSEISFEKQKKAARKWLTSSRTYNPRATTRWALCAMSCNRRSQMTRLRPARTTKRTQYCSKRWWGLARRMKSSGRRSYRCRGTTNKSCTLWSSALCRQTSRSSTSREKRRAAIQSCMIW